MFDRFLVRDTSLRNERHGDQIVGFTLAVKHANYRGCYLSLHNGYYLEIDGIEYPVDAQSFEINGLPPRGFDELKNCVWEHWDYPDEAILHVSAPGGLAPGAHTVRFQQSVLAAYGYLPTDHEWVQNPPKPGTGAGSDKTPYIVTSILPLQDEKEVVLS
ncbi:C-glycoside deglycosidase beta subunit domain-containing protein [Pengzhenrongella sp.]|uniref:C-glycoside deglycosidase beta subunit domain-containing protein n=1 Tax=Pengzhenrongella sp. TaxID=2888820 RepID=UPI002F94CCA4